VIDNCPNELTLSMHADRQLTADEAVATELHLATCVNCRARLAVVRSETSLLAAALARDAEPVAVPVYKRPVSRVAMVATAAGGIFIAVLLAVIPDLISGLMSGPITWFNPFDIGTMADLAIEAAIYLVKHAGAIMTSIAKTVLMAAFTSLVGWFAFVRRRPRGPLLLGTLVCVASMQPTPSHALEIRHGDAEIFVPAGETIDDTLIVMGETVEIAGDVTGDLIAVGRRVVVRGHVGGLVFAAAKSVTIDGEIDGSAIGAAETLTVVAKRIGRNLYGAGSTIDVNGSANVASNALIAGETLQLAGSVGRDVFAAGETIGIGSTIGGAVTAFAEQVNVLAPARIGGNLSAFVGDAADLSVSPSAVIGGEVTTTIREHEDEQSQYTTGGFYLGQMLRFAAAFVTGAILLTLVPSLRGVTINDPRTALGAAGLGLVTLVATPIIAVIVAMTIIGLPLGLFAFLLWLMGLYLAKLPIAYLLGVRMVGPDDERHFTVALALGLIVMLVIVNLPFIGGVFSFLMLIAGLGLLVEFVWRASQRSRRDAADAGF
jgi:hypothetical protein